ncbi:sensor histidine kinase [Planctomycetota bacterium]
MFSHMARVEWLASLGTLSSTVAHELKQPLTVIRLSLDDILDGLEAASLPPEAVIKGLKEALAQVSNLTSIIERFRNLARISPEKVVNDINVKIVAEKILNVLRKSAQRRRIELHLREMDRLPPICINEREIEQLFFALVENAIQAADGKNIRQLSISGATEDQCIELCFSDNCGGIAPEHLDEIFDPFFTTKPPGQGTGLGLCVVQKVVSRARGRIRVESEFGEGSTFFVILPVNEDGIS